MVSAALQIVQAAVSLSFLALGVFAGVDWLRHREQNRGFLALAFATLGLTSGVGQVNSLTGYALGGPIGDLALAPLVTPEREPSAPRLHVVAPEGEADSESRLA